MSLLDIAPIIEQMLLISENVSDLNFSCGQKPQVEINGVLYPASPLGLGKLSAFQTEMIAMALIRDNPDAALHLAKNRTADLSYALPGKCRFRVNIFQQRNSYSIVMRVIPHEVPTFESLQPAASIGRDRRDQERRCSVDRAYWFGKEFDACGDNRPY